MSASAAPVTLIHTPLAYSAVYQPVPAIQQWHAQSGLGDYSYGYQGGPSAKSEIKTLDGITQGSYSYVDAESKLQTVNYVADALGFRVAATNLPTPPVDNAKAPEQVEDTPEVKAAKIEHLEALRKAENSETTEEESAPLKAPEPVEDTEEVKVARAEHLKAVEVAKTRSSSDETETVVAPSTIAIHSPYIAAPHAVHISPYSAPVVLKTQQISPFAYSVYGAGIPHLITA
ncbi:hypothetical protein ACKWTF_004870 [Chironomus riparius]